MSVIKKSMRILLVMDPGIPVPPEGYGGIERMIYLLAKEYLSLGHEVHVLASSGSNIEGCVVHSIGLDGFPPTKKQMRLALYRAWWFLWRNRNMYDIVHNFGRLMYLVPILHNKTKKIMSYQREITTKNINIIEKFPNRNLFFTGCSENLIARAKLTSRFSAIHNAIDFSSFLLNKKNEPDAPLMFLGRIERIKGCHTAISIAKKTNQKLIIAGNISKLPEEIEYFETEIKPLIDNQQIVFVGEVNDKEKSKLLGISKALLMPIEWNEPFGIVMIESMACGTPVIAFDRGSVREVVEEGKTGCIVSDINQFCKAVLSVNTIDRENCRAYAFNKFHIDFIAKQYLKLVDKDAC